MVALLSGGSGQTAQMCIVPEGELGAKVCGGIASGPVCYCLRESRELGLRSC